MPRILNIAALPLVTGAVTLGVLFLAGSPAGAASPAPAASAARAAATAENVLVVNSGFTDLGILAQGHNKPIILSYVAGSFWELANGQRWTNLGGQIVNVYELKNGKTSECVNHAKGLFYLDSCQQGDKNELFWPVPTGSRTGGSPNYWYINVASSKAAGHYMYMTAKRLANGAQLAARPAGGGGNAAWNRVCAMNC